VIKKTAYERNHEVSVA